MTKIFLVAVIKYAARSNLRKEGPVYFNVQFKIQSILAMVSRRQELQLGLFCILSWCNPAHSACAPCLNLTGGLCL